MFWPTESWPGPTVRVSRLPPTVTVAVVVIEPQHVIERTQVADGHDLSREVVVPAGSVALSPTTRELDRRGRERDLLAGSVPPIRRGPEGPTSRPGHPGRRGRSS